MKASKLDALGFKKQYLGHSLFADISTMSTATYRFDDPHSNDHDEIHTC